MLTKRVRRALGALALAPLLITACDGNNPFDPFDDTLGTYDLTVFAGGSVPITFNCTPGECTGMPNGGTIRVNNGTLVLHDDGTYTERNFFTQTPAGGTSQSTEFRSDGTFSINGESLTLDDDNGVRFVNASLEFSTGDIRVNYIEGGDSYEYRKR